MSYVLSELKIKAHPFKSVSNLIDPDFRYAKHLKVGDKVAITVDGLSDHNEHSMWSKIAIGAGIGFVALPALVGFGGVGLAVGGEAMGIGALEVAALGSGTGAAGGKVLSNPKRQGNKVLKKIAFADMVGVVRQIESRWFGQPGYDVQVNWMAMDRDNDWYVVASTWHNPNVLYSLTKKDA